MFGHELIILWEEGTVKHTVVYYRVFHGRSVTS